MGRVVFIGAGPGAADLITVRGAHLLAQAEVVLFDALTDPALQAMGSFKSETIAVSVVGMNQVKIQQMLDRVGYK